MKGAEAVSEAVEELIAPHMESIMNEATKSLMPDSPKEEIQEAAEKLTRALMEALEKTVPKKGESPPSLEALLIAVAGIIGTNIGLYVGTAGVTMGLDMVHPIRELGFRESGADLLSSFQMPAMIGPTLQAPVWSGVIAPLRMRMNQRFPYMVPGRGELVEMMAQGLITEKRYIESMSFHAVDGEWSMDLLARAQRVPGFGELREMLWRRAKDEDDVREALVKAGMRSDFLDAYIELTAPRVGSGDLITMSVREAFEPRPGDEEMVERFVLEMAKWGYDRETCLWHWRSHWRWPALGEVFRMHQRGIDMPMTVEKYLKVADYPPEWRAALEELSWNEPGRIEARWMFRHGEIGVTGLRDLLVRGGLNPKYGDQVAMAVARNQFLAEINRLRDNEKRDFVKGYKVEEQLRANLVGLGFPLTWVEYHVQDALSDRERELKDDKVAALGDAWLKDIITDAELEERLGTVIVEPEALAMELDRLFIRKHKKPAPPRETEAEKALREVNKYKVSYAVLVYRKYAVDRSEFIDMLVEADMDPDVARARADYERLRRPLPKPSEEAIAREREAVRIQGLEERTAVEEYQGDLIDIDELLRRLKAVGLSDALAMAIAQLEYVRKVT